MRRHFAHTPSHYPRHISAAVQLARSGLVAEARAVRVSGADDGAKVGSTAWAREFARWLAPFWAARGDKRRERWGPVYVHGLLGPGERLAVVKRAFDPAGVLNPGAEVARAGDHPLAGITYNPDLPAPPPPAARAVLERVERERACGEFRLGMLAEQGGSAANGL